MDQNQLFYVVGRQKTITLHEAANTLQGLHLGSNVTGYGRTNASWSCNKILKVSKKCIFQDESSTQGKLPQYALPVLRQNQQIPPVPKSVAQIYVVRDNGIMPINQGLEESSKEMFFKKTSFVVFNGIT